MVYIIIMQLKQKINIRLMLTWCSAYKHNTFLLIMHNYIYQDLAICVQSCVPTPYG